MAPSKKILILDPNHQDQDQLIDALAEKFEAKIELSVCDQSDVAKKMCASSVFDLIIMDINCPTGVDGEAFLHWVKAFHSINVNTPIILFVEDIHRVKELCDQYHLHPEAKSDHFSKILGPVSSFLKI